MDIMNDSDWNVFLIELNELLDRMNNIINKIKNI